MLNHIYEVACPQVSKHVVDECLSEKNSRPEFRTAIFLYLDQSSDLLDELNALITYEDARLSL